VTTDYAIARLDEHTPWMRDVHPVLALKPAVARVAQHVFGELLNNAIDHSGATTVTVSVRQTPTHLHMLVSDDGLGVFTQLARKADLPDARAALELAKGRAITPQRCSSASTRSSGQARPSSQPRARHRAAPDRRLQRLRLRGRPARLQPHPGAAARPHRQRHDARLPRAGPLGRLAPGALRHRGARFEGVDDVGPSFIDEVFRVYAKAHPQVTLSPTKANARVAKLLQASIH
jgi:hypothetical protein